MAHTDTRSTHAEVKYTVLTTKLANALTTEVNTLTMYAQVKVTTHGGDKHATHCCAVLSLERRVENVAHVVITSNWHANCTNFAMTPALLPTALFSSHK